MEQRQLVVHNRLQHTAAGGRTCLPCAACCTVCAVTRWLSSVACRTSPISARSSTFCTDVRYSCAAQYNSVQRVCTRCKCKRVATCCKSTRGGWCLSRAQRSLRSLCALHRSASQRATRLCLRDEVLHKMLAKHMVFRPAGDLHTPILSTHHQLAMLKVRRETASAWRAIQIDASACQFPHMHCSAHIPSTRANARAHAHACTNTQTNTRMHARTRTQAHTRRAAVPARPSGSISRRSQHGRRRRLVHWPCRPASKGSAPRPDRWQTARNVARCGTVARCLFRSCCMPCVSYATCQGCRMPRERIV